MRPVREISAEEEQFRLEPFFKDVNHDMSIIRRNPVEPEPIGTIIIMAFKVIGYDQDCDGSLMARLSHINRKGDGTGWEPNQIGLYPTSDLVVSAEEFHSLFNQKR